MEITNEIKTKVFAQYLGQYIRGRYNKANFRQLVSVDISANIDHVMWRGEDGGPTGFCHINDCFLKLNPLSAITDEDAVEVAKICDRKKSWEIDFEAGPGKDIVRNLNKEVGLKYHVSPQQIMLSFQFLQSRGYDLPQYLLGGKTLHECNLCIYE